MTIDSIFWLFYCCILFHTTWALKVVTITFELHAFSAGGKITVVTLQSMLPAPVLPTSAALVSTQFHAELQATPVTFCHFLKSDQFAEVALYPL
jgi:hypothetical protein